MNAERKHRERSNSEQAIMAAAEELFLENGYSKTTTTMIAARAGVTHAMLHYYFRTKEHIFIKVVDKYMDELLDSFQPLMRKQAPFWETLETGISAHSSPLTGLHRLRPCWSPIPETPTATCCSTTVCGSPDGPMCAPGK